MIARSRRSADPVQPVRWVSPAPVLHVEQGGAQPGGHRTRLAKFLSTPLTI